MRLKKIAIGFVILVIVVILAAMFGVKYAEKHYSNRVIPVKDKVAISIGGIDLSLLKGGLVLSDVQLIDTLDPVATGSVKSVTVQGIHLWKLITGGGLSISSLNVEGVKCALNLSRLRNDSSSTVSHDSLGAAGINDSLVTFGPVDTLDRAIEIDTINAMLYFSASQLRVGFDSEMHPDIRAVEIDYVQYRPGKGKYDVDVGRITSSAGLRLIELDSFQLTPRYPKYEFGFQAGRRMASIDILINKINVREFDLKALTRDSLISIQSMVCHRAMVDVFSDKRVPIDMDRYGALPHEALLNASSHIAIDSVLIKDADVRFTSLNPHTMEEGYLEFKRSYVSVYNVTNIAERIEKNSSMTLDIYSKFTNEGELDAHFDFPLNRRDYQFTWTGSLGRMKLGSLDSFVLPVANLNIVNGYCHGLKFHVVSDYDTSRGNLQFQYTNLKIMAMDSEREKELKFLSGLANALVVKSNNLIGDKNFFEGPINFGREMNRGFPDYVWKSLEHGILYSIIGEGLAKRIENQPAKAKEKESRKEERRAKREAKKNDKKGH